MEFGVFLPVSGRAASRDGLAHAARTAEELGFASVWAADRIVIPWEIETPYAYNWSGRFFVPPEATFLEPMTALAYLAACTEKVKLGVSVLVLPYRDPVYWAKVATSIDHLSHGRLLLGVGVGWMGEEFRALGRGHLFRDRGRVSDEQLRVFRELLTADHCSFDGDFYEFSDIAFQPKAYDADAGIPVWVGGEAAPAQRRAGWAGDAWFPYFARVTPQELAARYEAVRRSAETSGRDPDGVRLNCCLSVEITDEPVTQEPDLLRGTTEQVAERLAEFKDVGVEHCALQFLVGRYPQRLEQMQHFADDVMKPGVLA